MKGYVFEYKDENDYKKKEKSVKKYNMLAYKKLMFDYYESLKKGVFLGRLVSKNSADNTKHYELIIPTDEVFTKVHGEMALHYTVYEDKKLVLLETISPESLLLEGHKTELKTYKGVMVSNVNQEKDIFKINLLKSMDRHE